MTNGWVDMKNTDMMLIMGGNPAENHPCGFKWTVEAKRTRNTKIISVGPRFTRTSAVADLFCQIRAGTDIAFLGGVVRYAIENNRIAKDYLVNYTNAAFIVKGDFKLPADTDGVFSGFDAKSQSYDKSTWNYAGTAGGDAAHAASGSAPPAPKLPEKVEFDLTLQNPNCVFQLLRKHYSRYTPEMVERITGIPREQFLKARSVGFVQLLGQHAEIRSQLSESSLRRRSHETKRLCVRLFAESGSQLFLGAVVGRHVQRRRQGHAGLRDERRGHRTRLAKKHRCSEEGGLARSRRNLSGRNQRILEITWHHPGRNEADSNHGVPSAVRWFCREGRFVHQFRALAALEEYGLADTWRRPAGPGHRGANFL